MKDKIIEILKEEMGDRFDESFADIVASRIEGLYVCPKCGNTGRCEPRTLSDPDGQECDCIEALGEDKEINKWVLIEELNEAYQNYIELLGNELDELASLATSHGWECTRFEAGKTARNRIAKAKEDIFNCYSKPEPPKTKQR